jgi:type I restriction enzyme S subunit
MNRADLGSLPSGWRSAKIGDLFDSWGGHTPSKADASYWGDGIPWVSSKEVKTPRLKTSSHSVTAKAVAETGLKVFPAGTVLVVVRSGILAHSLPVAITEVPVTINQDLKAFHSDEPLMNEWLALFLRMSTQALLASSRRDGTTVQSVQYPLLKDTSLPVPPLDQRRWIIDLVEAVLAKQSDALPHVAAARRAIERFHQAVLAAACSGALTGQWRLDNPGADAKSLVLELETIRSEILGPRAKPPMPITDAELPDIPATWQWLSVDALARKVVDGVHKTPTYVETGVPFITVRNLTAGGGISFDNVRYITEIAHDEYTRRAHPEPGDILISKDGTIGVTRAVRTDRPFSIFVSVAMVKPLIYAMSDYVELALSSPVVQRQMLGVGSGLQHLVLRDLKADGVPVPPIEEQAEIVRRVDELLALANGMRQRVDTATTCLDRSSQAVLAKAFRGELISNGEHL